MSLIADRLDNMTIRVKSPDNKIQGVLTDRTKLSIGFRPHTFESYSKETIQYQLERLATLLWTGFRKGYETAIDRDTSAEAKRFAVDNLDEADRNFRADVAEIHVRVKAPSKIVRAQTIGMRNWQVRVSDDFAEAGEDYFASQTEHVANEVLRRFLGEIAALKHKHFGYSFVKPKA